MEHFIGAGILPYAFNENKELVFLLGLEEAGTNQTRNSMWSDFGGRREKSENPHETAIREFCEESMNALCTEDTIRKLMKKPSYVYKNNGYVEYIVRLDYNSDVINCYNRIMKNFDKCRKCKYRHKHKSHTIPSCPIGLAEKIQLRWFTRQEIEHEKNLRPAFRQTYNKITKNMSQ